MDEDQVSLSSNINSNKLISPIIVSYEPGTGGNFLINCLALNNKVVFSSNPLACKQLANEFSTENKLQYLLSELDKIVDHNMWNDLGLGVTKLELDTTDLTTELYKNGLIFALSAHCENEVLLHKRKFPNSKVIGITNSRSFLSRFRPSRLIDFKNNYEINSLWNKLKLANWPAMPPAYFENLQESPFCNIDISDQIKNLLPRLQEAQNYYYIKDKGANKHACWTWDATWFLDENSCLENLETLYKVLDLGTLNRDKISCYYQAWIRVLSNFVT